MEKFTNDVLIKEPEFVNRIINDVESSEIFVTSNSDEYGTDPSVISFSGKRIGLMGIKKSGKSSIRNVLFHKMDPSETQFIFPTNKVTIDDISNNLCLICQIVEFVCDSALCENELFKTIDVIVFVIDGQDDCSFALKNLYEIVCSATQINPHMKFHIFVHKIDGLDYNQTDECLRNIRRRISDDIIDENLNIDINFYSTSIYDFTIHEAFSAVVQQMIPDHEKFEELIKEFVLKSSVEAAYVIDVNSKIFLASDQSGIDTSFYELFCNMIDLIVEIYTIYKGTVKEDSKKCFSSLSLGTNYRLLMRELDEGLAFVYMLREQDYQKLGVIDYNFSCLWKNVRKLYKK